MQENPNKKKRIPTNEVVSICSSFIKPEIVTIITATGGIQQSTKRLSVVMPTLFKIRGTRKMKDQNRIKKVSLGETTAPMVMRAAIKTKGDSVITNDR